MVTARNQHLVFQMHVAHPIARRFLQPGMGRLPGPAGPRGWGVAVGHVLQRIPLVGVAAVLVVHHGDRAFDHRMPARAHRGERHLLFPCHMRLHLVMRRRQEVHETLRWRLVVGMNRLDLRCEWDDVRQPAAMGFVMAGEDMVDRRVGFFGRLHCGVALQRLHAGKQPSGGKAPVRGCLGEGLAHPAADADPQRSGASWPPPGRVAATSPMRVSSVRSVMDRLRPVRGQGSGVGQGRQRSRKQASKMHIAPVWISTENAHSCEKARKETPPCV